MSSVPRGVIIWFGTESAVESIGSEVYACDVDSASIGEGLADV